MVYVTCQHSRRASRGERERAELTIILGERTVEEGIFAGEELPEADVLAISEAYLET